MKSDKVAHVVQGLRAGFHLGFNYSTSLKSATGNMASALLNPQVVENYLQSDRQGGGPLSSASPFLRQMINLLCAFRHDDHLIRLNQEIFVDLAWWREYFQS